MTKKRFLTVLCALIFSLMFAVSGCSFFDEEERREIENIYYLEANQDDKPGIMIVIEYAGDEYPDSMFFVPNGEEGEEGNGISDVQAELVEDGAKIKITVNYTDKTRDPSEFTFENSVFPTDFRTEQDEETGDWTVTITLSNGQQSTFTLHNGVDGADGDSVTGITTEEDEEGHTWIVITTSRTDEDGNPVTYRFAMPDGDRGEQGVGIRDVYVDSLATQYDPYNVHIVIILTDDTRHEVEIPKTNNWSVSETGEKPAESTGLVGDFIFDSKSYIIYYKDYTGWRVILDLSDKREEPYEVKLFAKGVQYGASYQIAPGSYFAAVGGLPTVVMEEEGFTFAGWYTEPCDEQTGEVPPTAAKFDDLTPVLGNLKLYARFVPQAG